MSKAPSDAIAAKGGGSKWHNTLVYLRQHWQLYLIFMLPAFLLFTLFWFPHRLGMENICEELLRTTVMSPP